MQDTFDRETPNQEAPPVQVTASTKRTNYFVRHWRGDLSLGLSYWVNGVLGTWFVALLGTIVGSGAVLDVTPLTLTAALSLFLFAAAIVVSVWQFVGIWRSASNHVSRGGTGAWATVAKVMVVLGLLKCVVLVYRTYIPQSVEMASILTGDAQTPSYKIRVLPGGTEVVFSGGVRAGCAKELERVLSTATQAKVLHIESPGGRINEARRMVQLVRQHGLITYTSKYCFSAATLVLMSGKERVMAPGAEIGFHRGTLPGATAGQRFVMDSLLRETMRSEGVSDEFTERVLATPSTDVWYPTFEEMREAGVLSSRSYIDNGKLEDKPDYIKRLEEWGARKPLHPDHGDLRKAVELYQKAADQGDAGAPPTGEMPLPSQQGKNRPMIDLQTHQYSSANDGAQPQPSVASRESPSPTVRGELRSALPEIFGPHRNIFSKTADTPLARYQKQVGDAIGSKWYAEISKMKDMFRLGTARLVFWVDRHGQVRDLKVIQNTNNEAFANYCIQSVREAKLPPMPEDLAAILPPEGLRADFPFTVFADVKSPTPHAKRAVLKK